MTTQTAAHPTSVDLPDPAVTNDTPAPSGVLPAARPGNADPRRAIAFMNQKGGVGKTTTTVNLGAGLARLGQRVLLIDLDPQAHLTLHLGIEPDDLDASVYDLLTDDRTPLDDVTHKVGKNLWVVPAQVSLAGAEAELAPKLIDGRAQRVLEHKLADDKIAGFDYVMLDCPPSLGLLTVNALTFADEVVVPMQSHFLSLQGLSKLLETVQLIRGAFNPDLTVTGMVLCMHNAQTILATEVSADLEAFLESARLADVPWRDARVLKPTVRRNIKLAECPSFGQPIFDYAPSCAGAEDYEALARALDATRVTSAG